MKTVKFKIKGNKSPFKVSNIHDPNWNNSIYISPQNFNQMQGTLQQGFNNSVLTTTATSGITWANINGLSFQQNPYIPNNQAYQVSHPAIIEQEIEISEEFLDQIAKYLFKKNFDKKFEDILKD